MIIADLNHFEIVTQETKSVVGGRRFVFLPSAEATAYADAKAVGFFTVTDSQTLTEAAAGVFSRSRSGSYSKAVG